MHLLVNSRVARSPITAPRATPNREHCHPAELLPLPVVSGFAPNANTEHPRGSPRDDGARTATSVRAGHRFECDALRQFVCPRWDSNPHCREFKARASASWATGARQGYAARGSALSATSAASVSAARMRWAASPRNPLTTRTPSIMSAATSANGRSRRRTDTTAPPG